MTTTRLYHTWYDQLRRMGIPGHRPTQRNLTALLVGFYQSHSVQLHRIAVKLPGQANLVSLTRRLSRFLESPGWTVRQTYDALIRPLLAQIARSGDIHLIVDGSAVGFHHRLLMVSVAYRRRAIPVAWTWVAQWVAHHRGHSSARVQVALLAHVQALLPPQAHVDLCGNTEFGAIEVIRQVQAWGWQAVLRQSPHVLVQPDVAAQAAGQWQPFSTLAPQPGACTWCPQAVLSAKHAYAIGLLAYWQPGEKTPWLLASTFSTAALTLRCYRRRMWTEALFGDLKGKGFDLETTHLPHTLKLSRLTFAVVLLYVWLVATGAQVIKRGLRACVDRAERRDLSIFQIGLRFIERCIANTSPFRITFRLVT